MPTHVFFIWKLPHLYHQSVAYTYEHKAERKLGSHRTISDTNWSCCRTEWPANLSLRRRMVLETDGSAPYNFVQFSAQSPCFAPVKENVFDCRFGDTNFCFSFEGGFPNFVHVVESGPCLALSDLDVLSGCVDPRSEVYKVPRTFSVLRIFLSRGRQWT